MFIVLLLHCFNDLLTWTQQVCLLASYMLCMLTYAFELQLLVYAECCHRLDVAHKPLCSLSISGQHCASKGGDL